MTRTNKLPIIVILLVALLFANMMVNKRSGGSFVCSNISGDARGYYAWLPAIFIYHDLNFKFYDQVELPDSTCGTRTHLNFQDYRYRFDGRYCDKYYPGSSFMMLPFFAVAHLATIYTTAYPPSGYSLLYFKIMAFSGCFYFLLGMLFFLKVLDELHCSTTQKTLTSIILIFGSNIIFYVIDSPLYSHVYSFALVSAFLYYCLRLKATYASKYVIAISFLAGWIFIARPVDICILLMLPFILNGAMAERWKEMKARPIRFAALAAALFFPFILLSLYKISTGHFFVYSYAEEGFNFLHPHLWQYLFSYDNGILPYTPLFFVAILLIPISYNKENKSLLLGCLVTLACLAYVNSSWWCWWYGTCFGCRSILDLLPLFGIPIALSLKASKRSWWFILPVCLLCCGATMLLYHEISADHYIGTYPVKDYWQAVRNGLELK